MNCTLNKKCHFAIFALILVITLLLVGYKQQGYAVGQSTPSRNGGFSGRKFAILVGVNDYKPPKLLPLSYARNDVEAIREQLLKIGFRSTDVHCLKCDEPYYKQPTKKVIENTIKSVLDTAEKDDIIFVALSGHGIEMDRVPRFCPIDTKTDNFASWENTTVSIAWIYDQLAQHPSKHKLMIVDACRNTPLTLKSGASDDGTPGIKPLESFEFPKRPGISLFQSCSAGQYSLEDKDLRHGIFSYYIIEGLSGEAVIKGSDQVTLASLVAHVTEQTKLRTKERQEPFQISSGTDFLLAKGPFGPPSQESGIAKLQASADSGNADACYNLGMCYFLGEGVPKNEDEAVQWFIKAANHDHTKAQSTLGAIYFKRLKYDEAKKYLEPAAKKKDAQALYFLGAGYLAKVYYPGDRYLEDEREEFGFLLLIASMKQGNGNAIKMLELHKDNGNLSRLLRGVPPLLSQDLDEWYLTP